VVAATFFGIDIKIGVVMASKVYISGKMSGLEYVEYSRHFGMVEELLVGRGVEVVNPVKIKPKCVAPEYKDYMLADIGALWDCDGIYMLANWRDSRGARIEHAIALELGLEVYYEGAGDVRMMAYHKWDGPPPSIM
jgi:hypothetical protein